MSEITATFVVEPFDITIQSPTSNINVTPTVLDVNIFSGGYSSPGGNFTELQYNAGGVLGGISVATFSNGNVSFSNIGNLKLPGGSNAYFLQTDGTGNLTWAQGTANVSGNGTAAGANTQIQISDGTGNFTSGPGFTFNTGSNVFTAPGNGIFTGSVTANSFIGNITGNANFASYAGIVTTASQPNITNVGNLSSLTVLGNVDTVNVFATTNISANGNLNIGGNITANVNITGFTGNFTNVNAGYGSFIILRTSDTKIALGLDAGNITQGAGAIAVGTDAGRVSQGVESVAIGYSAGENAQANFSVALGRYAGWDGQGSNSIAIGANAGTSFQNNNSIVLNATGANLNTTVANSFVVKPVRNAATFKGLYYNDTTGEITYANINAGNALVYGTSNIDIASANANITMSVNNTSNVVVVSNTGITTSNINANILVSNTANIGNLNATNVSGNGSTLTNLNASNITSGTLAQARLANASYTLGSTTCTLGATVLTVTGLASIQSSSFNGPLNGAATTAGTVTTNAQPNITSVGTLTGLTVSGNISTGNINNVYIISNSSVGGRLYLSANSNISLSPGGLANILVATANGVNVAGYITATGTIQGNLIGGNGSALTNLDANNISTGTLANARLSGTYNISILGSAGSATTAGTVTTGAQPNITSVGLLSSLTVNGNITAGNITSNLVNGNSNIKIFANSYVLISAQGTANVANIQNSGVEIVGNINATQNITGNNISATTYLLGQLYKQNYNLNTGEANVANLSGTVNFDIAGKTFFYNYGTLSSNLTLNLRGNSTTSLANLLPDNTVTYSDYIITNLNTQYIISNITVDGGNTNVYVRYNTTAVPATYTTNMYKLSILKTQGPVYNIFVQRVDVS